MDMDSRTRGLGGSHSGNIILLGDGTEVLTDQHDGDGIEGQDSDRSQREGTPGPEERSDESPASTQTEQSDTPDPIKTKPAADLSSSPAKKEQ